ncbi:GGDEF domain-containing protein [Blastococcus sp. CT_GayMR19]|uniref:GGDEF domain-containing protein n=1 Tax=Blastococcus sp. CT_GayMR19 TaxID=2559608 RepID=UPI0010739080|nr:GGDEF domain-containing protein [Blastococcus sp. CT_GayMR19]TFV79278.1 GGDEF domain-containing protein [Blastococcus sp. CT_GayMR19]
MSDRAAEDRRAAPLRETHRPGAARRLVSALRAGLYRPLAGDDDRVAHWVRHVRNGVLLTEVAALSVIVYALVTTSPGRHHPVLLAMAAVTMLCCPLLLLLPLAAMMGDRRGPTMFYVWSIATAAVVLVATRLDGGASSPLDALLFLTLGYLAAAYSPCGVVAMGGMMSAGYLIFVALPDPSMSGMFFLTVMLAFTMICAMSTAASWAAYDRQVALIRLQESLAATDSLTGIPNRRAFLDRVAAAVTEAAWGHPTVVCLVDLDGFKAVNDAGGHAAGDAALQAIAAALGRAVRETDTVARLGGDEFAVLADVSVSFSGEMLAERIREAVACVGGATGVTASVGVAEVQPGDDVQDLLHRADAAMYRSKTAGGNRVTAMAF